MFHQSILSNSFCLILLLYFYFYESTTQHPLFQAKSSWDFCRTPAWKFFPSSRVWLQSGFGDIPFHLAQVSKFAYGKIGDLTDPIYYGRNLEYPFVINFLSGMLFRMTGILSLSFFAPVLLLVGGSLYLLYFFYKKFFTGHALPVLLVFLFFLGGGFGGYRYIAQAIEKRFSFHEFTQDLSDRNISATVKMDAKYPEQNISFGSPLFQAFLHQRTFFIGFFLVLLLLALLYKIRVGSSLRYSVLAAVIYGILPISHTHSFIAASFILFSFFLARLLEKEYKEAWQYVKIVFLGLTLAAPQLFYLTGGFSGGKSFLHFRLGWMAESTIGAALFPAAREGSSALAYGEFLWLNFGLLLPAFLCALYYFFFLKKTEDAKGKAEVKLLLPIALSGLIIFLSVMLIRFQPWDFDDNKLLVYWQLFSLPFIIFCGKEIFGKWKKIGIVVLIGFSLCISFSGLIDVLSGLSRPIVGHPIIFDKNAIQVAAYVRTKTPDWTLVLTGESHRNPIASLAGKPAYLGYPGWLWSHGISYGEREAKLKAFFKDPMKSQDIEKEFPFSYILLDDSAVNDLGADKNLFDKRFRKIFESGQYILYQK